MTSENSAAAEGAAELSEGQQRAASFVVPRFVRVLEELARRKGFAVSLALQPRRTRSEYAPRPHLIGEWQGTKRQFLALRFAVPSFHFPQDGGGIVMRALSPVRAGSLEVDGQRVIFFPDFGPSVISAELRGEAEILDYGDRTGIQGSAASLLVAGVPKKRTALPRTGKRNEIRGRAAETWGTCNWTTRGLPDGSLLHVFDTEVAERERVARRLELERWRHDYECAMSTTPEERERAERRTRIRLVVNNSDV
jgi:hypothetical protein